MKAFLYLLPFFIVFSCSCRRKPPEPVIPDRELKEFVLIGDFYPEREQDRPANYSPKLAIKPFHYSSDMFCYKEANDKEPVYDENLKARFYDEKGKMLAEDFLRVRKDHGEHNFYTLVFYLPYHEIKGEMRIVRLNNGTEDIIKIFECCETHEELARQDAADKFYNKKGVYNPAYLFYKYDKELECYSSPFVGDVRW